MLLSAGWETQAAFGDGRQLLRKTGERERVIEREREREKCDRLEVVQCLIHLVFPLGEDGQIIESPFVDS